MTCGSPLPPTPRVAHGALLRVQPHAPARLHPNGKPRPPSHPSSDRSIGSPRCRNRSRCSSCMFLFNQLRATFGRPANMPPGTWPVQVPSPRSAAQRRAAPPLAACVAPAVSCATRRCWPEAVCTAAQRGSRRALAARIGPFCSVHRSPTSAPSALLPLLLLPTSPRRARRPWHGEDALLSPRQP